MTAKHVRMRAALLATAMSVSLLALPLTTQTAAAQIVYDPSNYAQNVIQAARALDQINNQVTSLQNQTQMLLNQARNLANLPQSSLQQLQRSIQNTQQLLGQAQHIAYDVQQIDRAFSTTYGASSTSAPDHSLIDGARQRWQNSVAAHQDALKVQAGVVGNLDTTRTTMSSLVTSSQAASGGLQAAQAGNQILALQTQQLLGQAQHIAYDVQQIDRAFSTTYGAASTSAPDQSLIDGARQRWQNSVAAHQDALKVQAGVVGNLDTNRTTMSSLVTSSQSATGGLQAAQAGNQILALQTQQLGDLTAVVVAQGRAQNIEAAQRTAAQEQGREQLRRFLTPGQGYQPGNARMFQQ